MNRGVLSIATILLITTLAFNAPPAVEAAGLTTYTTPLPLTFSQTFTTKLHVDLPPSPFTFYPNGTIKLADTQSIFLKFNVIPIPFQAPTSFQANNTYVIYQEKGPGPNCFLNWAFKQGSQANQQGNVAFVQMFGTAAQPCAIGATISIKLNAFGSQLQALNSTGGTTGTICDVQVAAIEWNFCPSVSTLTAVTLTYSAGTIQLKTTATTWSWTDPIALDGSGKCGVTGTSCNITITTANSPDLIIVACGVPKAGAGQIHCTTPTSASTGTFTFRGSSPSGTTNNITEWYAVAASTISSGTITCNVSGSINFGCNAFGVSGANTVSNIFDPNVALPALNTGSNSKPTVTTVSTNNANDMLIGLVEAKGSTAQTGGTCAASTCTLIQTQNNIPDVSSEYLVVSATQSSATVAFGTSTGSSNTWAMIADAIEQAGVNTVFTISATVNITPAVQEIGVKPLSVTLTATPSIQKIGKALVSAAVSITPSIQKIGKELVAETVSITAAIQKIQTDPLSATISITPSLQCFRNLGMCGIANYVFNLAVSISVKPALACILNGFNCVSGGGANVGDPVPYTWLLLIPLFIVIVLIALKKR